MAHKGAMPGLYTDYRGTVTQWIIKWKKKMQNKRKPLFF